MPRLSGGAIVGIVSAVLAVASIGAWLLFKNYARKRTPGTRGFEMLQMGDGDGGGPGLDTAGLDPAPAAQPITFAQPSTVIGHPVPQQHVAHVYAAAASASCAEDFDEKGVSCEF